MGLYDIAAQTYDNNLDKVGVYKNGYEPLAPVGHMITRCEVEVTIDADGNFVSAKEIFDEKVEIKEKVNKKTGEVAREEKVTLSVKKIIIPVTEASMSRTAGAVAHPLCDKLEYIAKIYSEEKFSLYYAQLNAFAEYTNNSTLYSILKYVENGAIVNDLTTCGINATKDTKVCWNVVGNDCPTYADKEIFDAWISYYKSTKTNTDVSYVTGTESVTSDFSLKGIVSNYGNAKIISSNNGKVFEGRYLDETEALSKDYDTIQKAENVLKWLVANYGVWMSGRMFIAWNPRNAEEINVTRSFIKAKNKTTSFADYKKDLRNELFAVKRFEPTDTVVIAAFDSLVPGRLATCYFNNMSCSDLYERMTEWDENCSYYDTMSKSFETVNLFNMVNYTYGSQEGERFSLPDKEFASKMQNIINKRINNARMDYDMVAKIFDKAKKINTYTASNARKIINTASAIINKYYIDNNKGDFDMGNVETTRPDRSYQFGRILAIYDKIEKEASGNSAKDTTAMKLERRFCDRPLATLQQIQNNVNRAYFNRIPEGRKIYFTKMINEALEIIDGCGEDANKPVKESFVLGFAIQQNDFYKKHTEE